ncbi:MAG: hypothetical protein Kow0090_15020 [Myxococcota bacterium]
MRKGFLIFAFSALVAAAVTAIPEYCYAQSECEYPNVLIVLDRSGSMEGSKWSAAKNAVNTMVYSPTVGQDKISYGLMLFPEWPTEYDCWLFICDCENCCDAGKIDVGVALNTGNVIMSTLNNGNAAPDGNTPLGSTLNAAANYSGINNPNKRSYVLLITDGAETCNGDPVGGVRTLRNKNIKTFVVGFGSGVDPDTLNQMAVEGGTQRSPQKPYYYQADNQAELTQALEAILRLVSAEICDGKDQDCDGLIDEDPNDPSKKLSQTCSSACGSGWQYCENGSWTQCSASQPSPEVCDGVDNDCDGQIDEPSDIPSLQSDINNCGACFNKCPTPPNAVPICVNGQCDFECIAGYHKENGICVGNCQPTNGGIEICDYKDNDCDGKVDEDGAEVEFGLRDACNTCDFAPEVCNGVDDNCDGKIDEGYHIGEKCDTGLQGICAEGGWQCDPTNPNQAICKQKYLPTEEICDGLDNNCDGQVDEWVMRPCKTICESGNEVCISGVWQECDARKPVPEVCNGRDDDCNGLVDDGDLDAGAECESGQPGVCKVGHLYCVAGVQTCRPDVPASDEICDGLDNDCNGIADDNLQWMGKPCSTGMPGICAYGTLQCAAGVELCVPNRMPEEEVCDGADNNCDGKIDEGLLNACGKCGAIPEEICDGKDNDCDGEVDEGLINACGKCGETPKEVCNSKDDDCDGKVDEGSDICPAGEECIEGYCLSPCPSGECPTGYDCDTVSGKKMCVSPCFGVRCELGFACNDADGKCYDLCEGVKCKSGFICLMGECVEEGCEATGCPEGYKCFENDCVEDNCLVSGCPKGERCAPTGECENDPCAQANCAPDEGCRDGNCFGSCAFISCAANEGCFDGACVNDPCAMKQCRKGEVCESGKCIADPCRSISCERGYVCEGGDCVGDPCLRTNCPYGAVCRDGQCVNEMDPEGGGHGDATPDDIGECVRDSDCGDGEECVNAYCEPIGGGGGDDDDMADDDDSDDDDNDVSGDDDDTSDDDDNDDTQSSGGDAGSGGGNEGGGGLPDKEEENPDFSNIGNELPQGGDEPTPGCGCRVR